MNNLVAAEGTSGGDGAGSSGPSQAPRGHFIRSLLRRAEVDRAVFFAVLARVWQLAAAPVTLVIVTRSFTAEVQGFYYTFSSLLALQAFVELAFYIVIINLSSHEWAHLELDRDGRIVGDPASLSRLVSLGRLAFKWYALASLVFAAVVGWIGFEFFARSGPSPVPWQGPWTGVVLLTSLVLWALPFNSLLEGCGQVSVINRFRLSQAVSGSLILWCALGLGLGLWASVASAFTVLVRDLYLLLVRYRRFFEPFFAPPLGPTFVWRTEVWPMQWRLGVSGLFNYFASSLFVPVMFRYHGPSAAGRMGLTLSVVVGMQAVALTWVYTKVPRMGILVARRRYAELDRLFARISAASVAILFSGSVCFFLLILGLSGLGHPLADRVLSPASTLTLLAGAVLTQVSSCLVVYLRAHKREPVVVNVVGQAVIGMLVWFLGGRYGATGAGLGNAFAVAVIALPSLLYLCSACRATRPGGGGGSVRRPS